MAERVDPPSITRLRPELGALVESRGFTPLGPKSEWTGKYNVFTWMRRSWKCDVLRLGWRKGPVASYFLDAHWTVSRAGESDLTAAGINPAFVRRGVHGFDLPTRFPLLVQGDLGGRRVRDRLVRSLRQCVRCARRAPAAGAKRPGRWDRCLRVRRAVRSSARTVNR